VATYGISLKNIRKMNLQLILNKNSPRAHKELEFDLLGITEKDYKPCSSLVRKEKKEKKEKEKFS
jgi:hypothetical protein